MKKFELTENYKMCSGHKLFQIRALVSIEDVVKAGEMGGYIEKEENLSQNGDAWVSIGACVYGDALVFDNSIVCGKAHVYEHACVFGNSIVSGEARVSGNASVYENSLLCGKPHVFGAARVRGNARVSGNSCVAGNSNLSGNAHASGESFLLGDVHLSGNAHVSGDARVYCDADVLHIIGLGNSHRATTAYKTEEGIEILCGCFRGGIEEFKERVVNTRSGKVREEYLKFAELINIYFGL